MEINPDRIKVLEKQINDLTLKMVKSKMTRAEAINILMKDLNYKIHDANHQLKMLEKLGLLKFDEEKKEPEFIMFRDRSKVSFGVLKDILAGIGYDIIKNEEKKEPEFILFGDRSQVSFGVLKNVLGEMGYDIVKKLS